MKPGEPNLRLVQGGRDEIEQELVKLILTTFPVPADEYNRLRSMLEPRSGRVSVVSAKVGPSYSPDAAGYAAGED
ncbi:MAG: hypothetical protein IPG33_11140 [Betaproteobacteria bacterium]|jgi:hypothetical protein|nr:hypothetical protein [Betaproteobacteria bacterium]